MVIERDAAESDLDLVALLADETGEVGLDGVLAGGDADKGEVAGAVGDLGLGPPISTGEVIVTVTPGRTRRCIVDHLADQTTGGGLRVHRSDQQQSGHHDERRSHIQISRHPSTSLSLVPI